MDNTQFVWVPGRELDKTRQALANRDVSTATVTATSSDEVVVTLGEDPSADESKSNALEDDKCRPAVATTTDNVEAKGIELVARKKQATEKTKDTAEPSSDTESLSSSSTDKDNADEHVEEASTDSDSEGRLFVLSGINLDIKNPSLVAICGAVGAGTSVIAILSSTLSKTIKNKK